MTQVLMFSCLVVATILTVTAFFFFAFNYNNAGKFFLMLASVITTAPVLALLWRLAGWLTA